MPGPISEPWTGYPSDPLAVAAAAEQLVKDAREHADHEFSRDLCRDIDALVKIVREQERLLDLCRDTPREVDAQRIDELEATVREQQCKIDEYRMIDEAMNQHAEEMAEKELTPVLERAKQNFETLRTLTKTEAMFARKPTLRDVFPDMDRSLWEILETAAYEYEQMASAKPESIYGPQKREANRRLWALVDAIDKMLENDNG